MTASVRPPIRTHHCSFVADPATWTTLLLLSAAGSKEKCGRRRQAASTQPLFLRMR